MSTSTGPPPQTQLDWLCIAMEQTLGALNVIINQQNLLINKQGAFMATIQDLKAVTDQLAANYSAFAAAMPALTDAIQALETFADNLKQTTTLSPADQTTLDEVVAGITNAAHGVATQTETLAADTTGAQDTVTPPTA